MKIKNFFSILFFLVFSISFCGADTPTFLELDSLEVVTKKIEKVQSFQVEENSVILSKDNHSTKVDVLTISALRAGFVWSTNVKKTKILVRKIYTSAGGLPSIQMGS
jgi:hypothetical protein